MSIVRRHFTRKLGWRLDADFAKSDEFRVIQFTPHNSQVLSIGGEKSLGKELGEQAKLVADNSTVIVLPDAGHWILEEKPKETTDALLKFLE